MSEYMIDRIKKLIEEKKLSATQFSDEIGIQRSSLSHVLSGRNKPSLDFMLKVKGRYPEISLDWLLLGKGNMRMTDSRQETGQLRFSLPEEKKTETAKPEAMEENAPRPMPETEAKDRKISEIPPIKEKVEMIVTFFNDGRFRIYRPIE
jgi:transcriptional regulator with XRE-family HTH domain